MTTIIAVAVILMMIIGCYLLSGQAVIEGSIFERKSIVKKGVIVKQ
jgi:hypothetical protein